MTSERQPSSLLPHRLICGLMLLLIVGYNLAAQLFLTQIRVEIDVSQRDLLRSIFYVLVIIAFPLITLTRHILLRLNQTMPGPKTAAQRYLLTILITQCMMAGVVEFGAIMTVLGDELNTLYIYSVLGVLGIFLHRPRLAELESISRALAARGE